MRQLRLKDLGSWYSGGTPPREVAEHWEGDLPWLSAKDIDRTALREPTAFITRAAAREHSKSVPAGTLLLIVRGMALAHGLPVVQTEREVAFNQDLRALVCSPDVEPRFAYYALLGARRRLDRHIDRAAHGTARVTESMYGERVDVPPVRAQRQIAEFLDRECERIAVLCARLEDLRSAAMIGTSFRECIASHGVGLPTDVGDAGAWSVLPAGWRVVLLGRILRQLTNGYVGPTRDVLVSEGVRYIQSTHIKDGCIDFARRPYFVSREWHTANPRIQIKAGDVLIVQTGKVGEVALVPSDFGEASCHALLIARADDAFVTGSYLAAWFRTEFGRHSLLKFATGALHPHLEAGEIRKLHVLVPPHSVQRRLVDATCAEDVRAAATLGAVKALAISLAEYRDALITEAVTGELNVTKLSDPQLDESARAAMEGERAEVLAT